MVKKIIQYYRESCWLPLLTSLLLLNLLSSFTRVINPPRVANILNQIPYEYVVLPLILFSVILMLVSLVAMFIAGIYQLRNNRIVAGVINTVIGGVSISVLGLILFMFLVSPPGVTD